MIHDSLIALPPYTIGPARAAKGTFPYKHGTLAEVDAAIRREAKRLKR